MNKKVCHQTDSDEFEADESNGYSFTTLCSYHGYFEIVLATRSFHCHSFLTVWIFHLLHLTLTFSFAIIEILFPVRLFTYSFDYAVFHERLLSLNPKINEVGKDLSLKYHIHMLLPDRPISIDPIGDYNRPVLNLQYLDTSIQSLGYTPLKLCAIKFIKVCLDPRQTYKTVCDVQC